jgi:hypothetical protein
MRYKGKFRPQNREKYKGNSSNIIYRSGWELDFMKYLDRQPGVLQWNSEEIIIPYKSPIDGKWHRYYPDFWVRTSQGESLIEIKPKKQTVPPKQNPKHKRRYLREVKLSERIKRAVLPPFFLSSHLCCLHPLPLENVGFDLFSLIQTKRMLCHRIIAQLSRCMNDSVTRYQESNWVGC